MNSLGPRLWFILSVILLLTVGSSHAIDAFYSQQEYRRAIQRDMIHTCYTISMLLENESSTGVHIQDADVYKPVMDQISSLFPNISHVLIFDPKQQLVVHSGEPAVKTVAFVSPLQPLDTSVERPVQAANIKINDQLHRSVSLPVYDTTTGDQMASVVIAVPKPLINQNIAKIIITHAVKGALFFLLSVLLIRYVLTRWVARPLSSLITVMKKAGEGDLDARARAGTNSAFSILGHQLNTLLDQVNELMESKQEASKLQIQYAQEQERRRLQEQLRHSIYTINSTLDEHEVIEQTFKQMINFTRFDRASIWIYDDNKMLNILAMNTTDEKSGLPDIDTERIRTICSNFATAPETEYVMEQIGQVHLFVVPTILRHQPAGAIILERLDKPFEESEIEYTLTFISQSGIAISNAMMYKQMAQMAVTDELTQLYNRRYFYQLVEQAFEYAREYDEPLSVTIFDIDYFKELNDRYGHFVGDEVLRSFAERLREISPLGSIVARFGGEEFICLMPNTDADQAGTIAEQMRDQIASTQFETAAGLISVTMSIGVSMMRPTDNLDTFLQRADEALYRAKEGGRNRIVNYK